MPVRVIARAGCQYIMSSTIGAIDGGGGAHIQEYARVAERAFTAVAIQHAGLDADGFGWKMGHGGIILRKGFGVIHDSTA